MNPNRAEKRKIETHNRLFVALRLELAEKGLDATTVQHVTDRADVALGTFYNHFEDKEAAITALSELELSAIRAARTAVDRCPDVLPRCLTTTIALLVHRGLSDSSWIRCLDALGSGGFWPGHSGQIHTLALATDARQRDAICICDAQWAATVITGLLSLVVRRIAMSDTDTSADALISESVRTILGALDVAPDVVVGEIAHALTIEPRPSWAGLKMVAAPIELEMNRL